MEARTGPPRPMTPKEKRKLLVVVGVYAVAIGFGVALFSGSIPGLPYNPSTYTVLDGHDYYQELYFIPLPPIGSNSTGPFSIVFHNVTFWIWTMGWYDPRGSSVHGNGTALGGTTYSFVLGGLVSNQSRVMKYVAPNGEFAVGWSGGFFLQILVEVPSA